MRCTRCAGTGHACFGAWLLLFRCTGLAIVSATSDVSVDVLQSAAFGGALVSLIATAYVCIVVWLPAAIRFGRRGPVAPADESALDDFRARAWTGACGFFADAMVSFGMLIGGLARKSHVLERASLAGSWFAGAAMAACLCYAQWNDLRSLVVAMRPPTPLPPAEAPHALEASTTADSVVDVAPAPVAAPMPNTLPGAT